MPANWIMDLLPPFSASIIALIATLFMGDPFQVRCWKNPVILLFELGLLSLWWAVYLLLRLEIIEEPLLIHSWIAPTAMLIAASATLIPVSIARYRRSTNRSTTWLLIPFLAAQLFFVLGMSSYLDSLKYYQVDVGHENYIKSAFLAENHTSSNDIVLDVRRGRHVFVPRDQWEDESILSIRLLLNAEDFSYEAEKAKLLKRGGKLLLEKEVLELFQEIMEGDTNGQAP